MSKAVRVVGATPVREDIEAELINEHARTKEVNARFGAADVEVGCK